jgi:type VI secretion system protein ImpF
MADLALNDRLQPALLDRLLDDERTITLIRIVVSRQSLEHLQLPLPALLDILRGQDLTLREQHSAGEEIALDFTSSRAHASPAALRSLVLRPPGAPEGIALQTFARLDASSIANAELEPPERRMLSRARLRECVQRDVSWLFNAPNLESVEDLASYPHVASSVLNFGLPSFAGRMTSSIDVQMLAEQLRRTVELFEPRLRAVRVAPAEAPPEGGAAERDATLEFTIEADLWGQPAPQPLRLRTKIDTLSGDVTVSEARGA